MTTDRHPLIDLLLGGRTAEQVLADVGEALARDANDPRPLVTEVIQDASGMLHGRVSPIRKGPPVGKAYNGQQKPAF